VLGRRAHHCADLVLIVVLALSPALLYHDLHTAGSVLAVVVALVLLRIERGTLYHDVPRPARPAPGKMATEAAGRVANAAGGSADQIARLGTTAGVVASSAVATATQLAPVAGRAAKVGVRSLGIIAGATRRVAREHSADRGGPDPS
jgi:hypothetical protein